MLVFIFSLSQYYQLINKNMERKEEQLWRKLKVQPTQNQQKCKAERRPQPAQPNSIREYSENPIIEEDEPNSPTFRKHGSSKSCQRQHNELSFSFGEQMLNQLELLLKQPTSQDKNYLLPYCIKCRSICTIQNQKLVSWQAVKQILTKSQLFLGEAKYTIERVKASLNNYKQSFNSQKNYWQNYAQLILSNIQTKTAKQSQEFHKKIQQCEQQKYLVEQKHKLIELRSLTLQKQVTEMVQGIALQRSNGEQLHKKIVQLNQQLHAKMLENTALLEENMNLKLNLKKIMNLSGELSGNSYMLSASNCKTNSNATIYISDDNCTDVTFTKLHDKLSRQRKASISSVCQTPQTPKDLLDFTQSLSFSNTKNEQYFISSPVIKRSSQTQNNQKILKQKQKNCFQCFIGEAQSLANQNSDIHKEKYASSGMNSLCPQATLEWQNTRSRIRRNSTTSTTSSYSLSSKYGFSSTLHCGKQSRNSDRKQTNQAKDKNKLLDRIKKLKDDINLEIMDLKTQAM